MTDHDDRLIPLPYEPDTTPSQLGFWAAMRELFRSRRNAHDERVARAVLENAPYRRADAERVLSQPGTAEKIAADAARVMGKVGGKS